MLKIAAALALAATSTEDEIVVAIGALKAEKQTALNAAQTPSLEKFVPRGDYDIALNRATTAEGKIAAVESATRDAEITRAIDGAIGAGKITPASKDFYVATCKAEGGLEKFKTFVAAQPSVFKASGLDKKDAEAAGGKLALNAEQKAAATAMGISEARFVEHLAAQNTA